MNNPPDWSSNYIQNLVDDLMGLSDHLSGWELKFVDEMDFDLGNGIIPTQTQVEKLEQIKRSYDK